MVTSKFLTVLLFLLINLAAFTQVAINTTGNAPDASSMLEITSTTSGLLIPRMTDVNRLAIVAPATGLIIYQTNLSSGYYYYDGTVWARLSAAPANTEWWIRPATMPYIQPISNATIRVYDAGQTYGIWYDGSTSQYAIYARTQSVAATTAAIVGFSDVAGNQTYGYLGYNGNYTSGTLSIDGAAVYGVVDDPNRTAGFFRTTGIASIAANINFSNVWIASFNKVDNATANYNPCGLYSELNVTNSALGGWHNAIQSYSNRGTTTGNPGYTTGIYGVANSQNEDAFGITAVTYCNNATRAGGYFAAFNYAGTSQAYAYVGSTVGGTARKIIGTNSVSEIIPTENHGRITLTCPESPEYWYQDYGTVDIINGKAHVDLDPILKDIIFVNDSNPIRVFCTPVNLLYFNGVTVMNQTSTSFDLVELNGGEHSGKLYYQIIVKPKTNYGEGRFLQAPGPLGLKPNNEPIKAKAKNQPNPNKIFNWPADEIVYGYKINKAEPLKSSK